MRLVTFAILALPTYAMNLHRMSERQVTPLGGLLGGGEDDDPTSTPAATRLLSTTTTGTRTIAAGTSTITTTLPPTTTSATHIGTTTPSLSVTVINGTSSMVPVTNTTSLLSTLSTNSSTSSISATPSGQSLSASVDAGGQTVMLTIYATASTTSILTVSSPTASAARAETNSSSPAISTGAIIGISVAVGIVLLSLIGCAIWRMKRKRSDEDEAIRWPELNRHGDSSTHHALPARQTGKHGFDTSPLERTPSHSSSVYAAPMSTTPSYEHHTALNGSSFGAPASVEEHYNDYNEKSYQPEQTSYSPQAHDPLHAAYDTEDYTSLPPPVQHHPGIPNGAYDSDEEHSMRMANGVPATYGFR